MRAVGPWRGLGLAAAFAAMAGCAAGHWNGGMNLTLRHEQATRRYVVEDVVPRGGAERAGLRPGDEVVAIDGVPLAELSEREVAEMGVGDVGSRVRVRVRRGDGEEREVVVERGPR